MAKRKALLSLMTALTVSVLALGGCGSASKYESASSAVTGGSYAYTEDAMEMPEEAEEGYFGTAPDKGSGIDLTAQAEAAQKLVYTCDISLETLQYDETMAAVKDLAAKYGAIIQSENTSDDDYSWYSSDSNRHSMWTYLTIRVPAESYQDFVGGLESASAHVRSKSQNVENITRAYSDQSILVEALEKQEKRLLEMMDKAETVEDMITVEARLSEVQTELNQAKTVLSGMDTDVNYSTVNLTIREVRIYSESTVTFGERLAQSFGKSWSNFIEWLGDLLIGLIYGFPFILVFVVFVVIVVYVIKAIIKASNKRRENKKTMKNMPKGLTKKASDKAAEKAASGSAPVDEAKPEDSGKTE